VSGQSEVTPSSTSKPRAGSGPSLDLAGWAGEPAEGGAITVALGRFDALLGRGLTQVLREDRAIRILASDLDGARLERAAAELTPRVAILDEASVVDPAAVGRLRGAHAGIGVIVLAGQPTVAYATRLFASGVSCLSKRVSAADVLAAVRVAASGKRVFAYVEGHLMERGHPERAGLTPREVEVLEYLSTGRSHSEIALAMGLGVETIRTHSAHIRRKLGVSSSRDLIGIPTRAASVAARGIGRG